MMVKPRPSLAAFISLITIRMMPIDSACRAPVDDLRAGRAQHEGAQPQQPADPVAAAGVGRAPRRRPRTPSTVLSRTGQTQPETMTRIFIVLLDAGEQDQDRHQHRRRDRPQELQHRLQQRPQQPAASRSARRAPMPSTSADARSRRRSRARLGSTSLAHAVAEPRVGEDVEDRLAAAAGRSRCCRRWRTTTTTTSSDRQRRGTAPIRRAARVVMPAPPRAPRVPGAAPGARPGG